MATATQRSTGPISSVPVWVREELQTAYLRVKGSAAAQWLWDRVLTPQEREKLGGELEEAYYQSRGAVGMWMSLRGVSLPQAVVTVATRLGFLNSETGLSILRALGEEPDDPTERVEAAVVAGGLVLVDLPRAAYWSGEAVEVDWARHTSQWELLLALARLSKGGGVVDAFALQERKEKDPGFVRKRKCRLVNAKGFPQGLADLVVGAGRGTYRLDLLPTQIRVFERGTGDVVREWTP
ncbi:MAG: hypothetical protein K8T91_24620 [Planctomycetes bacterium]|nr:hypothetical protein [Planctomycetota bacterium]